jgi:hypothetical protein
MAYTNFTSTSCGQSPGSATAQPGMPSGNSVTINGAGPEGCIISSNGSKVYSITMTSVNIVGGNYLYTILVDGEGPKGGTDSLHLVFKMSGVAAQTLSIYLHARRTHEVSFVTNLSTVLMTEIDWVF